MVSAYYLANPTSGFLLMFPNDANLILIASFGHLSGSCLGICIPFYLYTSQRIWSVFNMVTRLGSGQFTGCVTFNWCHGHMALNMSFLFSVASQRDRSYSLSLYLFSI